MVSCWATGESWKGTDMGWARVQAVLLTDAHVSPLLLSRGLCALQSSLNTRWWGATGHPQTWQGQDRAV